MPRHKKPWNLLLTRCETKKVLTVFFVQIFSLIRFATERFYSGIFVVDVIVVRLYLEIKNPKSKSNHLSKISYLWNVMRINIVSWRQLWRLFAAFMCQLLRLHQQLFPCAGHMSRWMHYYTYTNKAKLDLKYFKIKITPKKKINFNLLLLLPLVKPELPELPPLPPPLPATLYGSSSGIGILGRFLISSGRWIATVEKIKKFNWKVFS